MNDLTQFFGPNAGYALELYERFQSDPDSVDAPTRAIFSRWTPDAASDVPAAPDSSVRATLGVTKIVAAARVTRLIRELGHLDARLDPLELSPPPGDPGLRLETHGLETRDLAALPASVVGGPLAEDASNALEALGRLRRAYSGSVGYEDDHIQNPDERGWLRDAAESRRFFGLAQSEKRALLERLSEVEGFEKFLHSTFIGAKRFSLEGTDMLVPVLDSILRDAATAGTREVVMGMAHRGRLNVLAHILGKPYAAILSEFAHGPDAGDAASDGASGYTGDVKYHLGGRRTYKFGRLEENAAEMPVTLAPNPSHLEFVNPVAVGRARAAQERCDVPGAPHQDPKDSLAILIHGDAAFPGQGIVAETLNLSRLPGYNVGGAIHLIVNNQIGFTTMPGDSRSTLYASDLAKGFEIPIVHVNADDVEACIAVARMASAYREKFGKDFLIDLIGYRRFGHNEGDEPAFTQPRMYEKVRTHPTVRELWAKRLETENLVTRDEANQMASDVKTKLTEARTAHGAESVTPPKAGLNGTNGHHPDTTTGVNAAMLTELNEALLTAPGGFTTDAKLEKLVLQPRRTALENGRLTWAHAESLAFASILADGTPIRLTGQDAERGTFSQRHAVWHDPTTGKTFTPLDAIPQARASFAVHNSPLSENACLGFEYGYSIHATGALVLWEGQFGDFVNGAQVIIDQFLVSGNAKWGQTPSLVLLLPHGYEGSGPEHSSARLERFLELAADGNIRVVNPTTSAQYFHLLRRQAALLETDPRPLIVMAPKAFLKVDKPPFGSPLSDLASGAFQPVLADAVPNPARVTRLILCSGKVYTNLIASKELAANDAVAVARVEELYPFPVLEIADLLSRFPELRDVVWMQEEPQNMGAWTFAAPRIRELLTPKIGLRYAGRPASGSPAEGSIDRHDVEQARIIADALRTDGIEKSVKLAVKEEAKRGEESRVD